MYNTEETTSAESENADVEDNMMEVDYTKAQNRPVWTTSSGLKLCIRDGQISMTMRVLQN